MTRDRKPKGFFYLNHVTVDSKHNIILDAYVTPGNVHDSIPYLERLDIIDAKYGIKPKYTGADTGYFTTNVLNGLKEREIQGVIGPRRHRSKDKKYSKAWFQYIGEWDVYMCPDLYPMHYKTTSREGYSEYISDAENCSTCPKREKCLYKGSDRRIIRRHVDEKLADDVRRFMKTDKGKRYYKRRKETVERVFADAKELHGLRYAHYRGKFLVQMQCNLTATAQNIKKIATVLSKRSLFIISILLFIRNLNLSYKTKPLALNELVVC